MQPTQKLPITTIELTTTADCITQSLCVPWEAKVIHEKPVRLSITRFKLPMVRRSSPENRMAVMAHGDGKPKKLPLSIKESIG